MIDKKIQGIKNRKKGASFELRCRHELEDNGFIVCRFDNNVDLQLNKLIIAKNKYNPFLKRVLSSNSGFPDFIIWRSIPEFDDNHYDVLGLECKKRKYLDVIEKKKCEWLLSHNVFSRIIIAYNKKGHIEYKDFSTDAIIDINDLANNNVVENSTTKAKTGGTSNA